LISKSTSIFFCKKAKEREMKKACLFYAFPAAGIVVLAVLLYLPSLDAKTPAMQEEAGVEVCAECHVDIARVSLTQPHAGNSCVACHGDAGMHLEEGGGPNIFSYGEEDLATDKSSRCLTCHADTTGRYFASPHGKSAMDCTSCHVIHTEMASPSLLRTGSLKNCATCHQDVFAQFQLNERHRLQEGILSCTTCHDPHQPSSLERLGGFKHESCLVCHTDKGGPFLHEHGASRIEGCTACHEVHGSPNRHMLTHQSSSDLCFSCHVLAPDWHSRFDSRTTNCTVCHATIHGSNLSRLFLK
jgi:DmsE family decaheme c-type cytochrome